MKDLLRNSRDFLIENPDIDELKFYKMYSYFLTNLQRHYNFYSKTPKIKKEKAMTQIEIMEQNPHRYKDLGQDYQF